MSRIRHHPRDRTAATHNATVFSVFLVRFIASIVGVRVRWCGKVGHQCDWLGPVWTHDMNRVGHGAGHSLSFLAYSVMHVVLQLSSWDDLPSTFQRLPPDAQPTKKRPKGRGNFPTHSSMGETGVPAELYDGVCSEPQRGNRGPTAKNFHLLVDAERLVHDVFARQQTNTIRQGSSKRQTSIARGRCPPVVLEPRSAGCLKDLRLINQENLNTTVQQKRTPARSKPTHIKRPRYRHVYTI